MQVNLRGAVFAKYKNISSFAEAVGWGRKKASDIINERRRPSAHEMEEIAKAIGINDANTFFSLFFTSKSTM